MSQGRQAGFVVSSEVLLIAVVLVCGLITGWLKLRDQSLAEVKDSIAAIDAYLTGLSPMVQAYAQPYISGSVVTSATTQPITEEYTDPRCVATSSSVTCAAPGPGTPGGAISLVYGTTPTAADSGSAASFEASVF